MHIHRMADIIQMFLYALADIDLPHGNAERIAELLRICARATRGAKARHGHGDNILRRTVEQRKRLFAHNERKGGVHAA
ncbi:hypothetical protein SDC9_147113 [bioreactor metagenome]|uniref:Uncharacterized protein n=1 Tax=bioreactor metagenome TaxID=1076179 RepID=A0A645EFN3_9ZZZZ